MQMSYERIPPANPLASGLELEIWYGQLVSEADPRHFDGPGYDNCVQQRRELQELLSPYERAATRAVELHIWIGQIMRDESRYQSMEFSDYVSQKGRLDEFMCDNGINTDQRKSIARIVNSVTPEFICVSSTILPELPPMPTADTTTLTFTDKHTEIAGLPLVA
jgi:hypothetical protein